MQQPGTLIEGKYEILGKIREGGMGTIYRVRHRLLDEIRVVKVLRPETLSNEELKRRFVEEARTATRLKHANIGTIHDFALDEEGKAYLVMEYIDGINLADLVKKQEPPGLALSLEMAHQTLGALGYLHRKNIVHRDISPDNLMLTHDEDGRPLVKLIDLGIAKTLDRPGELTSTGVFLGKLKYASPEQFGALPQGRMLDGRCDLYALGVVLYELLTGAHPFTGESPNELLRAHLFDAPAPFARTDREGRVPPEVRAMVFKALEKKREDRFASAEAFDSEVVRLQRVYARPDELDDTARIISQLRSAPSPASDPTVTPSAQDRLDRQFVAGSTPHPSSAAPLAAVKEEATRTSAAGSIARTAAEADTQPLRPPPARRSWLAAAGVLAAVLAAALILLRTGLLKRPAPQTPPAEATAPANQARTAPALAARPAAVAERLTAPPAEPTALPEPTSALVPTAAPEAPDRLRHRAAQARSLASRDSFDKAREWASSHPVARPTPAERIAAAQEATPHPQPTAAPVAPTSAPAPARAATPLPAESQRAGEHATDEEKIRETVRRYEKAQSTLDSDLYGRVYPGVDKARVRAAFDELRSQSLEFEIQKIEVAPGGATAVVRGLEKRVAAPRVGTEQHLAGVRVITLEKRGDSWIIVRLGS